MSTGINQVAGPPSFGDPHDGTGEAGNWNGWLKQHSGHFDAGVNDLKAKLDAAFADLVKNPGKADSLAAYQSALAEYNMYRMMQSNSTKSLADQSKTVIRNLA